MDQRARGGGGGPGTARGERGGTEPRRARFGVSDSHRGSARRQLWRSRPFPLPEDSRCPHPFRGHPPLNAPPFCCTPNGHHFALMKVSIHLCRARPFCCTAGVRYLRSPPLSGPYEASSPGTALKDPRCLLRRSPALWGTQDGSTITLLPASACRMVHPTVPSHSRL